MALFLATQLLGIYVARRLLVLVGTARPASVSDFTATGVALTVLFTTAFIFFSFKFQRFGRWLYRVFLTLIMFSAAQALAGIWFGPVTALVLSVAVPVLYWLWQNVLVQNAVMLITLAAIGALLGLAITPLTAVLVLVVLSFYDIVAVYRTGHMVKLAQGMLAARAVFGFIIPEHNRDFATNVATVQPGAGFMILGSGDVILPLVLAAALVRTAPGQALVVAGFATLGALLTQLLFTNQRERRPMAALPPIAMLAIVGYLLATLLKT